MKFCQKLLITLCLFSGVGAATAQDAASRFPFGPIRLVVPFPAGGGTDATARRIANKLKDVWAQPIVVENRAGAGGNLGTQFVFDSAPDGHTLLVTAPAPLTTNRFFYKQMRFIPDNFEPISIVNYVPFVLVVRPNDSRFRTAAEFVAFAKANPGKLSYSTPGMGSIHHLTAEWFERLHGTKVLHVPYKGIAPALNDLAAGHVDFMFSDMSTALRLALGGKLSILASLTTEKVQMLGDVPIASEAGLKELLSDTFTSVVAPPGTPRPILEKLSAAINEAINSPEDKELAAKTGVLTLGTSPERAREVISQDTRRWERVIEAAQIKIAE